MLVLILQSTSLFETLEYIVTKYDYTHSDTSFKNHMAYLYFISLANEHEH